MKGFGGFVMKQFVLVKERSSIVLWTSLGKPENRSHESWRMTTPVRREHEDVSAASQLPGGHLGNQVPLICQHLNLLLFGLLVLEFC